MTAIVCGEHSPQERNSWSSLDAAAIDITCSARHNATNRKADDDGDVLQERRPEELRQNDRDEGQESNANEFWRAPSVKAMAA